MQFSGLLLCCSMIGVDCCVVSISSWYCCSQMFSNFIKQFSSFVVTPYNRVVAHSYVSLAKQLHVATFAHTVDTDQINIPCHIY